jgi:hypothetical protein
MQGWGSMDIRLNNKQFAWLALNSPYNETNIEILRRHYVDGVELKVLAEEAGFNSPSRIYTLIKRFEAYVEKKLAADDLSMTVVITNSNNEEELHQYDVSQKE